MADFTRDGKLDLLFQHRNGTLAIWQMENRHLVSAKLLDPAYLSDSHWKIKALGDWNKDNQTDILFQHEGDHSLAVWFMDGTSLKEVRFLNPPQPGGTWSVVAPK
jgi:hypothetical protein